MKTTIFTLALFTVLVTACYLGYKTGQGIYGLINIACIYGMGAVLVRKFKLIE